MVAAMKSRFSTRQILTARQYWQGLSPLELAGFWKADSSKQYGEYSGKSFFDWLVLSARQASFERDNDL